MLPNIARLDVELWNRKHEDGIIEYTVRTIAFVNSMLNARDRRGLPHKLKLALGNGRDQYRVLSNVEKVTIRQAYNSVLHGALLPPTDVTPFLCFPSTKEVELRDLNENRDNSNGNIWGDYTLFVQAYYSRRCEA